MRATQALLRSRIRIADACALLALASGITILGIAPGACMADPHTRTHSD